MKRFIRVVPVTVTAVILAFFFSGCVSYFALSAPSYDSGNFYPYYPDNIHNNDEFDEINENAFVSASETPNSYFSLNINTASYAVIRRSINNGAKIYKDQVLIEEMLNYFKFDYPVPESGKILTLSGSVTPCPWNEDSHLLAIGIKTEEIEMSDIDSNLVFLIDISGSMMPQDRLPLVQEAFILLAENLNQNDRVSVVTYASGVQVRLDGAMGYEKAKIRGVIEDLSAGGSTAGAGGIQKAYELAAKNFIENGNNRVILATDGDFNVGISSQKSLEGFISQKRETGVYLTVLGVGMGNQKNNKMETLANCGNGNFAYLDTINEARKVLIEEAGGTLQTVAKDAKAMVSFNPDYIEKYRQIGYENRQLTSRDWENSEKDAGELGAGRCITAVYEVILKEGTGEAGEPLVSTAVRFKVPDTNEDREISLEISGLSVPDNDVLFISAVVESALIMRNSDFKASANINSVISRLESLALHDEYKAEFLELMKIYRTQI
ncbi:MAG: von Willebrand factor type A domain-containing protein [Treponema sp.]|nr:von Willebrand factor type A domain-containing protein [Treponema sp.]